MSSLKSFLILGVMLLATIAMNVLLQFTLPVIFNDYAIAIGFDSVRGADIVRYILVGILCSLTFVYLTPKLVSILVGAFKIICKPFLILEAIDAFTTIFLEAVNDFTKFCWVTGPKYISALCSAIVNYVASVLVFLYKNEVVQSTIKATVHLLVDFVFSSKDSTNNHNSSGGGKA